MWTAAATLSPKLFFHTPTPKTLTLKTANPKLHLQICRLFTGIVEEVGHIHHVGPTSDPSSFDLVVSAKEVLSGTSLGDSIAVDGTCLTVTSLDPVGSRFTAGVSPETLRRTSLSRRFAGDPVNLERALTPSSRMGGHFVQGHVDGTGEIIGFRPESDSLWVTVKADESIIKMLVPKGFVAVDGTSLTVCNVSDEEGWFDFMLVKYTQENVVIPKKNVGDLVNLEVDILGKYVDKLLAGRVEEAMKRIGSA